MHSNLLNPQYSLSTQMIIDDLRKEPVPILHRPLPRVSYQDLIKEEHSMRFKHEQLLTVHRELILPSHYKKLLQLSSLLDNSLNFLKSCRNTGGNFDELKVSIERTYGR